MCELELAWLDMCINTKKSCCMRSRFDINCTQITSIDGMSLPWVAELRYLGVYIVSSRKFKCSLDYAKRASIAQPMLYLAKCPEPHPKRLFYN